ncbi:2071_t:CDS:2 [Scutellospora calospora]|uniref:2071_t:CDS:1 n=1 Tax=Scutellospora calospora TaxID=85575 RepID=A0ACA9LLV3_9GLOM|nr:2071_t:CDS:2 [Scutellospora calospora]
MSISKRKCVEIEKTKLLYRRIYLVAPVQPYEEDNRMLKLPESLYSTSDDEIGLSTSNSPLAEQNETHETTDEEVNDAEDNWLCVIENWIDMLNDENCLDNGEAISNEELEFELTRYITHPAEDLSAK